MFWTKPCPPSFDSSSVTVRGSDEPTSRLADVAPLGPGYVDTLLQACRAMRSAEWPEAEALLMHAAPLAGEDPAYWNLVGILWEVRGDTRAARRFYGRSIRADSRFAPAQQNMRRLFELDRFGHTRQVVALGDQDR